MGLLASKMGVDTSHGMKAASRSCSEKRFSPAASKRDAGHLDLILFFDELFILEIEHEYRECGQREGRGKPKRTPL